jgi:serine/threonine protein kinase
MDRDSKVCFDDAFEVGERIGAGGLGTVHACRARGKNDAKRPRVAPLVVKTVRVESDVGGCVRANVRAINRVDAEIRALRRLDACAERDSDAASAMFPSLVAAFFFEEKHPVDFDAGYRAARVVTTNPFGAAENACDLARLRVEARSRRKNGETNVTFPESEACFYAAQIVVALRYAHVKAKLAHGDVKPENVLVSRETGAVALCDFDLARASTDEDDALESDVEKKKEEKRRSGSDAVGVLGTPEYVAPELLRGAVDGATSQTDWYQLGVLAFDLVFGKTPFASPFGVVSMTLRAIEANDLTFFDALFAASAEDADGGDDAKEKPGSFCKSSASVSFLRFARALLEGDPAARLGDADVRAAEFFAPVEWEALERGGGLACYGAFETPDTTDGWILFASREKRSECAE